MHAEPGNAIVFPPFRLDVAEERLWRGQEPVALKPRAFAILRYLLEHPRRLVTKGELLSQVWGDVRVNDAVLKTHLREIRRALDDDVRSPRFIETAHRRGYRFVGRTEASVLGDTEARSQASAPQANGASGSNGSVPAAARASAEAREVATVASASADRASPSADVARPAAPAVHCETAAAPPHFVGRTSELQWLEAAYSRAVLRERQLLLVSGPAGIGKTSFVRSFLAHGLRAASVAWGQCVYPYGAEAAYLPLMEAFSRLGRGPDRARWSELFNRCAPGWVARLPSFQPAPHATPLPAMGDSAGAEHLVCQLADVVDTFAREEPLLLVLEDVQWADAATVSWLTYIAQRTDPARLLVLCTFRPLEVSRRSHPVAALKHAVERRSPRAEIRLPALSPADLGDYFAARFAGSRLQEASARLLHECSAGNPSLVVRVADRWIEQGRLVQRAGEWRVSGEAEELRRQTPEHVLPLLEQEYEQLTEAERDILDAASVVGAEFSAASVAGALGANLVAVEELCVRWAKHGQYFRPAGNERCPDGSLATRFAFVPPLYRDAAYHRLGAARRAELHLGVARWHERAYGERSAEIAGKLAFHFEQAHDYRRAAMHLCTAAERSLATRAHTTAGQQLERCLALLQHLSTSTQRARIEIRLQVGVATLLAATRHDAVARSAAAQTALVLGRHFLASATFRDDEMGRLRSMLLLGMAEACLGDLSSAHARLEYATVSQQMVSQQMASQQTVTLEGAVRESTSLITRPASGQARHEGGIPVPSVAQDHRTVASAQAMVLAPVWHAMLRSFLSEAGVNDAFTDVPSEVGVPWAESPDVVPLGELQSAPVGQRLRTPLDPGLSTARAQGRSAPNVTLVPGGPPAQWVEGLLHHALSEADSWFGENGIGNDLDLYEPQSGYR